MLTQNVRYGREALPVLRACDVVVVGGSFAGVASARVLARSGRQVVLVEPRTYLGREVTSTLRPWISIPAGVALSELPEVVAACLEASDAAVVTGEVPLHPDAVKRCLEDVLFSAGVELLYASFPVELCSDDGGVGGVVIGNKSGRQVLTCQAVVDATETALMAILAGAEFEPESKEHGRFFYTLEFDKAAGAGGTAISVPQHLGLVGNQVILHAGYRGSGHVLVECELAMPSSAGHAVDLTRRETAARRIAMGVAAYLLSHVPAFRGAELSTLSHGLYGAYTSPLLGPPPAWVEPLHALTVTAGPVPKRPIQVAVSAFAGPVVHLWCLNEAARLDGAARELMREPLSAGTLGAALAQILVDHWGTAAASVRFAPGGAAPVTEDGPEITPAVGDLRVKEPKGPQRGRRYAEYPVRPSDVSVLRDVDVVVVGGGTSGAIAAITAAREGMRTVLVEMNPGLGGTGTYGGVHSYWFGRRVGFAAQSMEWVDRVHDNLGYPRLKGDVPQWNSEAKIYALMQAAEDAGVEMLLNAVTIGAVLQEKVVCGVIVATPVGPIALLAQVVIDATGDGDVAAYAGAPYGYGSGRDHAVMWYSLAQFSRPGRTRNNFASMVDVSNISDYNRAILAGRRRGSLGRDHDHGIYVAPRESRHIQGDVVITLNDQLLQRCWPDVISIALSNNDIKGHTSSDWMRVGLIPPNLEIEIPYRALLPRGLENILVVGKAISANREALPAIRMQPDLENLGGVAGLAAALAVRGDTTVRDIDIGALQNRLMQAGVLPELVVNRKLVPWHPTEGQLQAWVDAMRGDRPLYAYSDMELSEVFRGRIPLVDVCCAGPQAVPILERALQEAEGPRRVLLALALALLGSSGGLPVLVAGIQDQLAQGHLPERQSVIRHAVRYAPDQAAMPDTAYLIYALGMARDRRALPIWQQVVDLMASATDEDVTDQAKGVFHYVDAVCYGAERVGDPRAIPILKQLHSYPPFHGQTSASGFQPDYLRERQAYLEVVIGRSLARCGSPDGVLILIDYLNDVRGLLAEHAHSELIAITGKDFGKDVAAWSQWLELAGEDLQAVPWSQPAEPVRAWGETILTAALSDKTE